MNITGVMFYYYYICKRKLWYFANNINMEEENENVRIGKILDEESYAREDKHIMIDGIINLDFVKDGQIIHEVKKSNKIEEASIWQLKYYLYYLKQKGLNNVVGEIDYPLLKKTVKIELADEDEKEIQHIIQEITAIISSEKIPEILNEKLCKKCAYNDLCNA